MSAINIVLVLVCVLSISCGQLLFKKAGVELDAAGTWFHWRVATFVGLTVLLYGATTFLWVYVLSRVPLNQAYPFFALSFIIVPLLSWLVFREQLGLLQILGFFMIIGGILLITRITQT